MSCEKKATESVNTFQRLHQQEVVQYYIKNWKLPWPNGQRLNHLMLIPLNVNLIRFFTENIFLRSDRDNKKYSVHQKIYIITWNMQLAAKKGHKEG